ncbi:hypothetical protein O7C57_03205 [Providencia sp. 21OH12SH02B-Prov]|nr:MULTISPECIES: hypothetical protein [unclassified Providencia]WBA57610.1 hypothetical protein O7C57_03205 [Providencia sp. 21OH12SH02B-Prov]
MVISVRLCSFFVGIEMEMARIVSIMSSDYHGSEIIDESNQ